MDRERSRGAVFFMGPVETELKELKLDRGRLLYIEWVAGGEDGDGTNNCYLLKRLEGYQWGGERITFSGEFLYQHSLNITRVDERDARTVRRTFSVDLPVRNGEELREALDRAMAESASIPRTTASEKVSQYVDAEIRPIGGALAFLARAPAEAVRAGGGRSVDGTMTGFVVIGGKHHPEYTYPLPDGTLVRTVDDDAALEDVAEPETVEKVLGWRFPRSARGTVARRDPRSRRCRDLRAGNVPIRPPRWGVPCQRTRGEGPLPRSSDSWCRRPSLRTPPAYARTCS